MSQNNMCSILQYVTYKFDPMAIELLEIWTHAKRSATRLKKSFLTKCKEENISITNIKIKTDKKQSVPVVNRASSAETEIPAAESKLEDARGGAITARRDENFPKRIWRDCRSQQTSSLIGSKVPDCLAK
ncbi:uncharacterized protein LOC128881562 [Hylaeus volcanicus]|uniref:uncharacterized protein LOC128881562 n=1 Tax=Hylaeus volcanicus TaxID=313075 RepID=UPI0023B7B5AE|nr:uncharacterized protein LOC128881562 [Hylaeus volcanicus]